jgi:hypothetical protein
MALRTVRKRLAQKANLSMLRSEITGIVEFTQLSPNLITNLNARIYREIQPAFLRKLG